MTSRISDLGDRTHHLRTIAKRLDTNGDGVVSKAELAAARAKLSAADAKVLDAAHRYLSRSGPVTTKALDATLNEAAANAIRADSNRDGFVSTKERRGLGPVSSALVSSTSRSESTRAKRWSNGGAPAPDRFGATGPARGRPERINDVLDTLDPAHNRKYLPRGARGTSSRETFCNVFAQDALHAMGVKNVPSGNANQMNRWFNQQGTSHGWRQVSAREAQQLTNQGHPAVASWNNSHGAHGHIAVLRPGSVDGNPHIAQAGGRNFNDGRVSQGFGRRAVQYFVYDGDTTGGAPRTRARAPAHAAPASSARQPAPPPPPGGGPSAVVTGDGAVVRPAHTDSRGRAGLYVDQGEPFRRTAHGSVTYSAGMSVDTDGAGAAHGDRTHQRQTSLEIAGRYANGDVTPYLAVPPAALKALGLKQGDLIKVTAPNGHSAWAMIADSNDNEPGRRLGEGSRALLLSLGYSGATLDPNHGGLPPASVRYEAFPGSRDRLGTTRGGFPDATQLAALGRTLQPT